MLSVDRSATKREKMRELRERSSVRGHRPCRRPALSLFAAGAVVAMAVVAGCSSSAGSGGSDQPAHTNTDAAPAHTGASAGTGNPYTGHTLTYIVPSSAGGGFDTSARLLQPYLAKALGTNVEVVDKPGGEFAVGSQALLNSGSDCYSAMINGDPDLLFAFLTQKESFTNADFHAIIGYVISPAVILVNSNAKWKTLKDLIADAKAHPGKIKMALNSLTSGNYLSVVDIEQATGANFNVVPFKGGHEAREAVVSGVADVTDAGLFEAQDVANKTKVLAVDVPSNKWPSLTDNAPTVNDALGINVPSQSTTFAAFATESCYQKHPDRYQALVRGFEAAVKDPDYLAKLKSLKQSESLDVIDGTTYNKQVATDTANLQALLKKNPDLFGAGS